MTMEEESTMGNKIVNFIITSSEHPSIKRKGKKEGQCENVKHFVNRWNYGKSGFIAGLVWWREEMVIFGGKLWKLREIV